MIVPALFSSLFILLITAIGFGLIASLLKIPRIVGYLVAGIMLGVSGFNILSPEVFDPVNYQSAQNILGFIFLFGLITITLVGGVQLKLKKANKVKRASLLHGLLPTGVEAVALILMGHYMLGMDWIMASLMAMIIAASSPAIIIPFMVKIKEKTGDKNNFATMHLSSGGVEGITFFFLFRIVLVIAVATFLKTNTGTLDYFRAPLMIINGIVLGLAIGWGLSYLTKKYDVNQYILYTAMVAGLVGFAYIPYLGKWVSTLAMMYAIAITLVNVDKKTDFKKLQSTSGKMAEFTKLLLFSTIGAIANFSYVGDLAWKIVLMILIAMTIRFLMVYIALLGSSFTMKERTFSAVSSLPKATWQASSGGIALVLLLPSGMLIAGISVIAIAIAAPIGSILMNWLYKPLMENKPIFKNLKKHSK